MQVSCKSTCPCPGERKAVPHDAAVSAAAGLLTLLTCPASPHLVAPADWPANVQPSAPLWFLCSDLISELQLGGGGLLLVPTDEALLQELDALNATGALLGSFTAVGPGSVVALAKPCTAWTAACKCVIT